MFAREGWQNINFILFYHLIDKAFLGIWPGQKTKRNTTLNDTGRVKYLKSYIGALLNAIRYVYFKTNLDT